MAGNITRGICGTSPYLCPKEFYEKCDDLHTWNGYLALAIDGTFFQRPQTQRNIETFGVSVNQNFFRVP